MVQASFVLVDLATGNVVSGAAALGKKTARCTIVGTARANMLRGTSKKDVICGSAAMTGSGLVPATT